MSLVFTAPQAVFDGARYVVAWAENQRGVQLRFISPNGAVQQSEIADTAFMTTVALAASPTGTFVAWDSGGRIRLAHIPHGMLAPGAYVAQASRSAC